MASRDSALCATSYICTYKSQNFFGSQVTCFLRDPSCSLCSKSSTMKGLLYAPDPEKRKKGMLSDQPQLLCVTSMALLCHWGRSHSKMWHPLGLTLRPMPYGRGTLRILLQRFHSEEGPHYCLKQSARKLSLNKQQSTLFTSLEIPWGFHTQAVLCSLARPRSRKKESVQGF
jgi:hypothetical protein